VTWIAPILLFVPTLFDQSVARVLEQNFPAAQFVLIDIESGSLLARRWTDPDLPLAMGSLVKPFTALASSDRRRVFRCNPKQCWLRAGHGDIGLVQAIQHSCNSYFLQLAHDVSADRLMSVTHRYGLPMPQSMSASVLAGVGGDWLMAPTQLLSAYAALAKAVEASVIRDGMRASARSGTAKAIRVPAFAKTGTAPCSHAKKAPGDGYVVALYPAPAPKYALLVQVHGVSGAVSAATAAQMLTVLRDGK
jgi:cell division protein FtsI/penicillin-binding protein 2